MSGFKAVVVLMVFYLSLALLPSNCSAFPPLLAENTTREYDEGVVHNESLSSQPLCQMGSQQPWSVGGETRITKPFGNFPSFGG